MILENITLKNFRNHSNIKLNFNKNITSIYGNNGLGKTNILEAINLISTTKSLKSEYDKDMIKENENFLKINAEVTDQEDKNLLELTIEKSPLYFNKSIKKVKINNVSKTVSNFSGQLKSVIFTPSDLDTLFSSPSTRRKFLDSIFYQISPEYKKAILSYTKSLKQRNKLLEIIKETSKGRDQLQFWNNIVVKEGQIIQNYRDKFFNFLNDDLSSLYEKLKLKNFSLNFIYEKNEISFERLEESKDKEFYTSTTCVGPHKDDFKIFLNEKDVSQFGSRGQQRMSLLALKFLELEFIFNQTNIRPLLLLDDIFSELDEKNKNSILNLIQGQQTIITSVYKLDISEEMDVESINIENIN